MFYPYYTTKEDLGSFHIFIRAYLREGVEFSKQLEILTYVEDGTRLLAIRKLDLEKKKAGLISWFVIQAYILQVEDT